MWTITFDLSHLPSLLHETAEQVIHYVGCNQRFPPNGCELRGRIVTVEADKRQRRNLRAWTREHGLQDLMTDAKHAQ